MAAPLGPRPRMSKPRMAALRAAAGTGINDWQAELDGMLDYGELTIAELPDPRDRAEARELERKIQDANDALESLARFKG